MGALPSQHPPDWWNISAPCFAASRSISASAASVAVTRRTSWVMENLPSGMHEGPARPVRGRAGRALRQGDQKKPSLFSL